jgi:hypothetical protein
VALRVFVSAIRSYRVLRAAYTLLRLLDVHNLADSGYRSQLRVAQAEVHLVGRAVVECLVQPPAIVTIEIRRELLSGFAADIPQPRSVVTITRATIVLAACRKGK